MRSSCTSSSEMLVKSLVTSSDARSYYVVASLLPVAMPSLLVKSLEDVCLLLAAPGLTTRNKKLLVRKGIAPYPSWAK